MISEALRLHVEGGRVSLFWGMCVVSHGYGGLDCGRDGMRVGLLVLLGGLVACRGKPEHFPSSK